MTTGGYSFPVYAIFVPGVRGWITRDRAEVLMYLEADPNTTAIQLDGRVIAGPPGECPAGHQWDGRTSNASICPFGHPIRGVALKP